MPYTSPYTLRADYVSDGPVSAADLNRRARILTSQLPGALRAAGLSAGVLPLWNPDESVTSDALISNLSAAALGALRVSLSSGSFAVAAGAAAVLHPAGALVYTQTSGLSTSIPVLETGASAFVHLMLSVPTDPLVPGALDSLTGSPPQLLVSDLESEVGGLLLASYSGGVLVDRRRFSATVLLALQLAQAQADIGYNPTERAKGTLAARLNALLDTGDDSPDGTVTRAEFNAVKDRISVLEAEFHTLLAQFTNKDLDAPVDTDILADNQAIQEARLNALDPDGTAKAAISAVTANAGHGQNSSADFTPTTGDAHEMPFDLSTGRLG